MPNTPKKSAKSGWSDKKWKVVLQDNSGHEMIKYGKTYEEVWEAVAYSENFDIDESRCYIYERAMADVDGNRFNKDVDSRGQYYVRMSHGVKYNPPKGVKVLQKYHPHRHPEDDMYLVEDKRFSLRWVLYEALYGDEPALSYQMSRENFDPRDYL